MSALDLIKILFDDKKIKGTSIFFFYKNHALVYFDVQSVRFNFVINLYEPLSVNGKNCFMLQTTSTLAK